KNAGDTEQHDQSDHQPVKRLDDRGGDEAVPLKQILKIEHRWFSRQVESDSCPTWLLQAQGLAPNRVPSKPETSTGAAVFARRARAMQVGGLRLPQITATIRLPRSKPHHDNAYLRRFQTRSFRHVRTAPRHA